MSTPTFQEKPAIDANPDGYADRRAAEIGQNLHLALNGVSTPLHVEQRNLSFPEGQGGLPTFRLEIAYSADLRAAGFAGWKNRDACGVRFVRRHDVRCSHCGSSS